MTAYATLVRALARRVPVLVGSDRSLDRALAFLGSDLRSGEVAAAAVVPAALAAPLAVALASARAAGIGASVLIAGAAAGYAIHAWPRWLARVRRTRALGAVPGLIGLAMLRARVTPTAEGAAAFAAEHGRDPLAASLREHVRGAAGTPRAGWRGFAATWGEWDPSLRRAVSLLDAGVAAPPGERERLLDRALDAVLDGTRERVASFAASVEGPAGGIYAFGVVLPLALVAALPAAGAAGVPVTVPAFVAVYDLLLPLALVLAGAWLLARRPAAFPPAPVPRSHPDVPDRHRAIPLAAGGAVLVAAAAWLAGGPLFPTWSRPIVASGAALGVALVVWYAPVRRVRRRVVAVEEGLPDALALVGGRVRRGESPETAVAAAARELDGPIADVLGDGARRQRQLGVGVEAAFLAEEGALATVPSPRTRAGAALLAHASREGAAGGRVLVALADHVDDLLAVERDARHELARLVGTLRTTACCFGPLIGGATVALAGRLDGFDGLAAVDPAAAATAAEAGAVQPPVATLGVAVGGYVLAMAAILSALAAVLDRGFDPALVGYHAGVALLSASLLFPVAVRAVAVLV